MYIYTVYWLYPSNHHFNVSFAPKMAKDLPRAAFLGPKGSPQAEPSPDPANVVRINKKVGLMVI
jgi:hypothetical protein